MRILLAIDGSKQSDAAVEKLTSFLGSATHIKIISVVERIYTIGAEPFAVSSGIYAEVETNAKKNAESNVNIAQTKLEKHLENADISTEVFIGNPSQTIVEEAEKWQANLIVVGSHGYGFWQRTLLGSVSTSVIHHASCSVLVVK